MSQFNFSIEHIKGKENVIADVLSRCTYKETEIPTSEKYSPPSPPALTSIAPTSTTEPYSTSFPFHKLETTKMPHIRTHKNKPTPGPSRRRSLSPLPNLAEMWERTTNPAPQAVYSANVQTRAQAQRGRSVTRKPNFSIVIDNSNRNIPLNQLGPGQTSPGRSYAFQGPNQTSAAQDQEPEWVLSDISSDSDSDQE